MRITIDLSADQIADLDRLAKTQGMSRADVIRAALSAYLARQKQTTLTDRPGFGAWKGVYVDGVNYQRRIRLEWADAKS